jgi:integrase
MARELLTDKVIKSAKPRDNEYTLNDGEGLTLLVRPDRTMLWAYRYTFGGARKKITPGSYPATSLKLARAKHQIAQCQVEDGKDPKAVRAAEKQEQRAPTRTFQVVGEEQVRQRGQGDRHHQARALEPGRARQRDRRPAAQEIEAPELLAAFRKAEKRQRYYTATPLRSTASRVFQFGIRCGDCTRDPAADLSSVLTIKKSTARPALTDPKAVGNLMRQIEIYQGKNGNLVRHALKLIALTMVRPGEHRKAEWSEFDKEVDGAPSWIIPADKMKMRREHVVPLPKQALAIIEELRPLTGGGRYLFSYGDKPMSEATINKALRIMGYDTGPGGDHCAHGFRTTASTLLNGERINSKPVWHPDVIETQLAHGDEDSIRGIYNRAQYWPERVKLMQHWADKLDQLRTGTVVLWPGASAEFGSLAQTTYWVDSDAERSAAVCGLGRRR